MNQLIYWHVVTPIKAHCTASKNAFEYFSLFYYNILLCNLGATNL